MKVFVTGASGFVGREIIRQLGVAGHAMRILSRRPMTQPGVKVHAGNILDPTSLAGALDNIDAVIHLVGIISEAGGNTFEQVHTRGTENMAAAAKNAGVGRFIHMSALGTRSNAVSRYHKSKWAAEEIVRQSGLDWTIFRPSIIYGPEDRFTNLFARMARFSPILPVMGKGNSLLQPIPVADVGRCFVGALGEPRSIHQTYDLCGRERLTFVEIIDAILAATNRKRLKLRIPMSIARVLAAALEFVFPKLLGKAPPLNRDQLLMLNEDNVGNPEPAETLFKLRPIPFGEGLRTCLRVEDAKELARGDVRPT